MKLTIVVLAIVLVAGVVAGVFFLSGHSVSEILPSQLSGVQAPDIVIDGEVYPTHLIPWGEPPITVRIRNNRCITLYRINDSVDIGGALSNCRDFEYVEELDTLLEQYNLSMEDWGQ